MSAHTVAAVPSVSRDELIAALRRGRTVLIDVLSPESYSSRHIDGAVNVPVADIAARARQVVPDLRTPIVVYCGGPT